MASNESVGRKMPSIVIVGIGGGGSRILSEGLEKIVNHQDIDRYNCLTKAIRANTGNPHTFIVDTSADPTTKGFFENIPQEQKISLSSTVRGMSRGAGGRPGRAAKAVLNEDVVRNLADNLYVPITEIEPAIVVIIHTADGGTGGGLTPEILQHLGYVLPASTVFWLFTVLPRRTALALQGPRTVAPTMGKLLKTARRISDRDFTRIPHDCRHVLDSTLERQDADQSYEFQHSRIAIFPLSNHHFAQCWKDFKRKEIREEVLNPFPIELLSQALYPFLKYVVANPVEQSWMQDNWPLGPIDIPDIMAGLSPERPFVVPHLWIDPPIELMDQVDSVLKELHDGVIQLEKVEDAEDTDEEKLEVFTFRGSSAALYEFRATSIYCVPVYPEGSDYFDEFSDFVSDVWFPKLSGMLNFIGGREGLTTGVISHAANLKPQPIPAPEVRENLGFENGMLVSLLFGAVPMDMPIWLEATRDIIVNHQHEEFWEISYYDANDFLRELAYYIGWPAWPETKYMEI
ncbi:MAG: hypothetical protein KAJ51_10710 [Thermoplasmata archaeon]|nr:hypothetical protein [Thermoplasmata archaeon]